MMALIKKYYLPAALFILTIAVSSVFSMLGVDPHHHGIMFKPALDVAHGQMLFRDTFTQYGALTTLLQAWALQIFGDYLVVIQIETAFFYALISLCLYYLWLNILPQWLTVVSVLIWLLLAPYYYSAIIFQPWSSVPALFFQLFSLILVLRAFAEQNRIMLILAGSVAVLTFWCRQPVGVFHCASILLFLATTPLFNGQPWKSAMTDCAFFFSGIVAASVPFFIWLGLNDAFHDMFIQSIKAAFFIGTTTYQSSSHNLFINLLMALAAYQASISHFAALWFLFPFVCLCLLAIGSVMRWCNRDSIKKYLRLYGLLLISLASWMQYYPVPCLRHLYWAATPMIGIFSYCVWQLSKFCIAEKKGLQILMVSLILILVFKNEIINHIYNGSVKISIFKTKIEEPQVLRGMYTTPAWAKKYKTISGSLQNNLAKNPKAHLVNMTPDALYLTFIGPQKNFHPLYITWESHNNFIYPDYLKRRDEFINKTRPLLLSYEGKDIPGWSCIDVFDIIDEQERSHIHGRKLALYQFTSRK